MCVFSLPATNARSIFCSVAPYQDASDHKDDIPFFVGDPYKPLFATATGKGKVYWSSMPPKKGVKIGT